MESLDERMQLHNSVTFVFLEQLYVVRKLKAKFLLDYS